MKKAIFLALTFVLSVSRATYADVAIDAPLRYHTSVVGGGIVGALESYYAFKDAQKEGAKICVTVYEKGHSFGVSNTGSSSTNTSFNIVPSLTTDEILSVVPRGSELMNKLAVLFSMPGGIRVDDVLGVNDSEAAIQFKEAVTRYGSDKNHDDRTMTLLMLGKRSMELWQQMYDEGDGELKAIMAASNFNPCKETANDAKRTLHDGYRIDLIYGIENAEQRARNMKADYDKLGYKNCCVLSPDDVVAIDPFLAQFCQEHSELDAHGARVWRDDSVALWRPGGCIDTNAFLPRIYGYLKRVMGQYQDANGQLHDCFELKFDSEVVGVEFDSTSEDLRIARLKFSNGAAAVGSKDGVESRYVFCPGESVGTLHHLGFSEPSYAAFAGPSLLISIPLSDEQVKQYETFSHCMEVHNEGIVLAWQARLIDHTLFIGVAGTKAFYGDKSPSKEEAFAKNRNLVQLNMINNVLPDCLSIAYGYHTNGKALTADELSFLETKGIANRWVGRRAVAYDGFPTMGPLYYNNQRVANARCTTHLGSGGVSFGPGAVNISRSSEQEISDPFVQKILAYADSRRAAE